MIERKVQIKYDDKSEDWNEWIHVASKRLAKSGSVLGISDDEVLFVRLFLFLFSVH